MPLNVSAQIGNNKTEKYDQSKELRNADTISPNHFTDYFKGFSRRCNGRLSESTIKG